MIKYHVKYDKLVNPEELKEHPKNVNKHPESQISALTKYIEYTGWRDVITVSNLSGYIVKGHARKLASIRLGCKAPVVYQDFADEAEERSLLLLDNHLAELAEIDIEAKNMEILALQEYDIGEYSLDDFGLDLNLGGEVDAENTEDDSEIDVPLIETNNAVFIVKVSNDKINDFYEKITSIEGVSFERKKI